MKEEYVMPGHQPETPQPQFVSAIRDRTTVVETTIAKAERFDSPEDERIALAERVEAEFMYQYESMAPHPVNSQLGIAATRIGGGVLSMRNDVTGYWSKAVGFGVSEPVTSALIDEVLEFYRAESSPGAVIQISPSARPADWDQLAAARNFRAQDPWFKLMCRVEDFGAAVRTELRVGPVAKNDAREWAAVALRGFGMPEQGLGDMMATAAADHPGFRPFAAWDGDEIVASANLFIYGEVGSLNSAATLPDYRAKGAQSALLAARAKAAAEAGCRWLVAETGVAHDRSNPSLNNMLRFGLRPRYERQNWAWTPNPTETTS
jgi:GNAT superfamily N-acetyltransferase